MALKWPLLYPVGPEKQPEVVSGKGNIGSFILWGTPVVLLVYLDLHQLYSWCRIEETHAGLGREDMLWQQLLPLFPPLPGPELPPSHPTLSPLCLPCAQGRMGTLPPAPLWHPASDEPQRRLALASLLVLLVVRRHFSNSHLWGSMWAAAAALALDQAAHFICRVA